MPDDFDKLMSGMGVKRLDKKAGSPPPKRRTAAAAKRPKRTPPNPAKPGRAATAEAERIAALERGIELANSQRDAALKKVKTLRLKVKRAVAEAERLQAALDEPTPSVADRLNAWGYTTREDRRIIALTDGWLERVLTETNGPDEPALQRAMAEQFVRVCSRCIAPDGLTSLPTDPAGCSCCGGYDLNAETRRFLDAVLINGRLRVLVIGRDAEHQRLIRDQVVDSRLVLTQIPGTSRREPKQAQLDVQHADAVIIWDPASVSDELLAVYRAGPRTGEVPPGPLGAFLAAAAAIVGRD
ncbi:MAG: hypothetical protein VX944_08755 [Myxococcota bacterium]|nr:hypothetical protein [Myxococcota bacterium]